MTIVEYNVVLRNTTLQYLSANIDDIDTKPIVVMMHGFPECSWAWEAYLTSLTKQYCVVAPDLPGYHFSPGFDSSDDYNIQTLITTMKEFIDAILACSVQDKIHLVAHDWGGAIAWPLAAFHSEILHSLSIINAAHPSAFTREMRDNAVQQDKSEYIADFLQQDAVHTIQSDGAMMFKRLFGKKFFNTDTAEKTGATHNFNNSLFSERQLTHYTKQWMDPNSMENMLNYYRKMPQLKTKGYASQTAPLKIPNIRITIPTLVIWGENDSAFVIENLLGLDEWVSHLCIRRIPGASHWVHHEKPEQITQYICSFIAGLDRELEPAQ